MKSQAYSPVAVFLHWIVALFIFALLGSGWALHNELINTKQLVFQLYQWHKSIGVTVLILIAIRIVWRFKSAAPAVPAKLENDKKLIHAGHLIIYALLVIMPISGWLLVSSNPQGIPTIVFGYFDWHHFSLSEEAFEPAKLVHYYAAWIISLVVIGHIGMAVKHQLKGIKLIERMKPSKAVGLALLLFTGLVAAASVNVFKEHTVDLKTLTSEKGFIEFSGEHAGNEFVGVFEQWQLFTDLDMQAQSMQEFVLTVELDSAKTGNSLYDSTLKETDWFDVENHPTASYTAKSAQFLSENTVQFEGDFSIKGKIIPLSFILSSAEELSVSAIFSLQRSSLGIGQESDPDADWVSEEITIKAKVNIN